MDTPTQMGRYTIEISCCDGCYKWSKCMKFHYDGHIYELMVGLLSYNVHYGYARRCNRWSALYGICLILHMGGLFGNAP